MYLLNENFPGYIPGVRLLYHMATQVYGYFYFWSYICLWQPVTRKPSLYLQIIRKVRGQFYTEASSSEGVQAYCRKKLSWFRCTFQSFALKMWCFPSFSRILLNILLAQQVERCHQHSVWLGPNPFLQLKPCIKLSITFILSIAAKSLEQGLAHGKCSINEGRYHHPHHQESWNSSKFCPLTCEEKEVSKLWNLAPVRTRLMPLGSSPYRAPTFFFQISALRSTQFKCLLISKKDLLSTWVKQWMAGAGNHSRLDSVTAFFQLPYAKVIIIINGKPIIREYCSSPSVLKIQFLLLQNVIGLKFLFFNLILPIHTGTLLELRPHSLWFYSNTQSKGWQTAPYLKTSRRKPMERGLQAVPMEMGAKAGSPTPPSIHSHSCSIAKNYITW